MFDSDDDDFPAKCSVCGHEWHEKIGRLKMGEVRCPHRDCMALQGLYPAVFDQLLADARNDPRLFYSQFVRLRLRDREDKN